MGSYNIFVVVVETNIAYPIFAAWKTRILNALKDHQALEQPTCFITIECGILDLSLQKISGN